MAEGWHKLRNGGGAGLTYLRISSVDNPRERDESQLSVQSGLMPSTRRGAGFRAAETAPGGQSQNRGGGHCESWSSFGNRPTTSRSSNLTAQSSGAAGEGRGGGNGGCWAWGGEDGWRAGVVSGGSEPRCRWQWMTPMSVSSWLFFVCVRLRDRNQPLQRRYLDSPGELRGKTVSRYGRVAADDAEQGRRGLLCVMRCVSKRPWPLM